MSLFTPSPHPTTSSKPKPNTNTPPNTPQGFTIVELLIVIVVIAILAAISVVAYNGVQERAVETTVRSDFSNFLKSSELYYTDKGYYPGAVASLKETGITLTKSSYDAAVVCIGSDNSSVGIVVDAKNGKSYYVSNMQKTFSLYTNGKVQGKSGGVTCPNIGIPSWQWLLQTPTGAWTI